MPRNVDVTIGSVITKIESIVETKEKMQTKYEMMKKNYEDMRHNLEITESALNSLKEQALENSRPSENNRRHSANPAGRQTPTVKLSEKTLEITQRFDKLKDEIQRKIHGGMASATSKPASNLPTALATGKISGEDNSFRCSIDHMERSLRRSHQKKIKESVEKERRKYAREQKENNDQITIELMNIMGKLERV